MWAYNLLRTKHFHGALSGNQHPCLLKSRYGKVSFYTELKNWRIYHVKKMLLRFMVKQAAEQLKPVMSKSAATRSRAGMTLSIDNSVMDRFGKLLRCTWSW